MSRRLEIDFVVYQGDPDDGVDQGPSAGFLEPGADRSGIEWPGAYGAITVKKNGTDLLELKPDPIFKLVTHMVRSVGSLIRDGEPEAIEFTESEHGFLFDPSGEDVSVSFFVGSAFDPDDYLVAEELIALDQFAEQILSMGERLRDLIKAMEPEFFEEDNSLNEFLELGREALTTLLRQKERGLR